MRLHINLTMGAILLGSGCATGPQVAAKHAQAPPAEPKPSPLTTVSDGLHSSWNRLAHPELAKLNAPWDWVTGLPNGGARGDALVPTLSGAALTRLLPRWHYPEVQLASAATTAVADYRIAAVNDMPVANCDQLHAATLRALGKGKNLTVRIAGPGEADKAAAAVAVEPAQLLALAHATAPGERLLRVTEDGNPWVLLRQDGLRCKVTARVERQRAILQLALSVGVCDGDAVRLPREVRASCDGTPLECLSVAETLDVLYAGGQGTFGTLRPDKTSFAVVSERDDYRVPTNYKRLEQMTEKTADPAAKTRGPALLSILGMAYPGPGLLGDARALSMFVLQRQTCRAGEPEQGGWIIFSGNALQHGSTIDLDLDLGLGPQRLTFKLPSK
jgi:hypothetical protein